MTAAPYMAAYAARPANWPALRQLFRDNPDLAGAALAVLARNASTAPAVLALADQRQKLTSAPWLPSLLNTLAQAGQYAQAHDIWAKAARVQPRAGELLDDSTFTDRSSPPPFNWALTSSTVGLAERQPAAGCTSFSTAKRTDSWRPSSCCCRQVHTACRCNCSAIRRGRGC